MKYSPTFNPDDLGPLPPIKPRRAHELRITIGADDIGALRSAFEEMVLFLRERELSVGLGAATGTAESGWSVDVYTDPTMTAERYRQLLQRYLDSRVKR